jgi:hypothetical protein
VDLKEIGVGPVGHRRVLLDAITALRSDASSKPPSVDPATTSSAPSAFIFLVHAEKVRRGRDFDTTWHQCQLFPWHSLTLVWCILNMRLHCSDAEEKQPPMYGAQIKLRPDKKIELIMEPMDQQ